MVVISRGTQKVFKYISTALHHIRTLGVTCEMLTIRLATNRYHMYEEDEDMEEFSDLKMSAPEISQGYAGFIMDGTLTMHFFSRKHKMNRMVQVDISFRTDAHAYMKRTCENKFTLEERQGYMKMVAHDMFVLAYGFSRFVLSNSDKFFKMDATTLSFAKMFNQKLLKGDIVQFVQ